MYKQVRIEKCPCGSAGCPYYFLVGIGSFVQGSGFTLDEAQEVAQAINERRARIYGVGNAGGGGGGAGGDPYGKPGTFCSYLGE